VFPPLSNQLNAFFECRLGVFEMATSFSPTRHSQRLENQCVPPALPNRDPIVPFLPTRARRQLDEAIAAAAALAEDPRHNEEAYIEQVVIDR
jgi:hypothetical protein